MDRVIKGLFSSSDTAPLRVLVTGGCGNIGIHILQYLLECHRAAQSPRDMTLISLDVNPTTNGDLPVKYIKGIPSQNCSQHWILYTIRMPCSLHCHSLRNSPKTNLSDKEFALGSVAVESDVRKAFLAMGPPSASGAISPIAQFFK